MRWTFISKVFILILLFSNDSFAVTKEVDGIIRYDSATIRDKVYDFVVAQSTSFVQLKDQVVIKSTDIWTANTYDFEFSVRYSSMDVATKQSLVSAITQHITTYNSHIRAGSFIKIHDCNHDTGRSCTNFITLWQK
jgi:hypothetical protein